MKKNEKARILVSLLLVTVLVLTGCSGGTKNKETESTVVTTTETATETPTPTAATESTSETPTTEAVSTAAGEELEDGVIKILYGAGLCGIPIHIAKQLQFFEAEGLKEGVDYTYVTSSTSGVEMLSTKQADVSFGLVAAMLAPLDNGLEAKTVLGVHTGCIQLLAGNDSGITSLEELKGKRIGVENLATSPHIVAQRALASVGIGSTGSNMEVEFVVFPKADLPVALKEGKVDAIAIGDPQASILVSDGDGVSIFNSATSELLKDEYCCSLWARNETIEKLPKKLAKVVTAIQKASLWIDQNKDLAAEIQLDNEWLVGDLAVDQKTLADYKYLPSVSGVEAALSRNILDMKELGLIRKDTDADTLAKNSFIRLEGVEDVISGTIEAPIDPASQLK
ncbi:ABC transporter substrate-binding protein [Anaerocolumna sp. AGMB13020]|uniref:ABC transporter substrate-binding protein n=1 Tax=Anaerocolumna sp. AGMB13020 TaxID=3081750 RepID=UPI0029557E52|nr:ABC transporter substrate-binding protein [Anaerocolumna sp. AGMB13020]WOO36952.1 ABC transporter substrate-binding protein [Anaerocolumna sp. AGMB13020]